MIDLYSSNTNLMDRNKVVGMSLCKGGCNQETKFGNWCRDIPIHCPVLRTKFEDNRRKNISNTKRVLSKLGFNPMQNPEICRKNHSPGRNKKSSESLKRLGQLGLLPQQTESKELKEKRRKNVSKSLRKLSKEENLWFQKPENWEKVEKKNKKISHTLKRLWEEKKISRPKIDDKESIRIKKRLSRIMRERVKFGWKPPHVKKIPHIQNGNLIFLRSEFEKRAVKLFDKFNIDWQFEPFSVQFWNSRKKKNMFTIPDFFIPEFKSLIEIKGEDGKNSWLTKDKVKGMEEFGFNVLVLGKNDIERLENSEFDLIEMIKGVSNNA